MGKIQRFHPIGSLHQPDYIGTWKDPIGYHCLSCQTRFVLDTIPPPSMIIDIDCPVCAAEKKE